MQNSVPRSSSRGTSRLLFGTLAGLCLTLPLTMGGCPGGPVVVVTCPTSINQGGTGQVMISVTDANGMNITGTATITVDAGTSSITVTGLSTGTGTITVPAATALGMQTLEFLADGGTDSCTFTVAEPPPCTTAADCDDDDACTMDACEATGCTNTPMTCPAGQECQDGTCVDTCETDADCADGDACNGDEVCTDGTCAAGEAVNCDDSDACTTDTCNPANGTCSFEDVDCDDGLDCTDDSCDGETGCVNESNCPDGQFCTEDGCVACQTDGDCDEGETCDNGACVGSGCETDADCDDEVFCNGIETCNDDGVCVAGEDPCAATVCSCMGVDDDPICEEGDAGAECSCEECPTIDCSLDQDNLSGSTTDDEFSCGLVFNGATGTQVSSFQTGDIFSGLAGTDTLSSVHAPTAAQTIVPTMSGIENHYVTNFGSATLTISGTNVTGLSSVCSVNSVDDIVFSGQQGAVNGCFMDINDTSVDLDITMVQSTPTSGSADTYTLTMENAQVGDNRVTTGSTNGYETVAFVSNGTSTNLLTSLTQVTGTTMASATISGEGPFAAATVPNTILSFDGSANSGGIRFGSGTTAGGYTTFNTANLTTMTLGSGDDAVIFGGTFTTNDFTGGNTLDCGEGDDYVQNSFAGSFGAASPLRNCEEVRYNATANGVSVNMSGSTGLTTLTNECDGTANTFTFQNVPANGGVYPMVVFRGDGSAAAQTCDTVTYSAIGNTGASDTLSIDVNNRGVALNATGTTNVHTVGAITANAFETINVNVTDGPGTFGGITSSTLIAMNVTASSNATLGTVNGGASTIITFDATGVAGNTSATLDDVGTGASISTAAGNDTIVIGSNSGATSTTVSLGAGNDSFTGDDDTASDDVIDAGAGADTVNGNDGNDTVTTGDGSDSVIYNQATASNKSDITDFTTGTGGDTMTFDISDHGLAGGDEYVGAVGGMAVDSSEEIVILTGTGYATDEAAEDAVAARVTTDGLDVIIVYFNTTNNATHIIRDADAGVDDAASTVLLGQLQNITTQAAHDTLTADNINSQA